MRERLRRALTSLTVPCGLLCLAVAILVWHQYSRDEFYRQGDAVTPLSKIGSTDRAAWTPPARTTPAVDSLDGDLVFPDLRHRALIDTDFPEVDGVFTPDGRYLLFASERTDGAGGFDLYWSEVEGQGFSLPRRLPSGVNTAYHERSPSIAVIPGGGYLLAFTSNRASGSPLDFDVFVAKGEFGGEWTSPLPVPQAATPADERAVAILAEGETLLFSRPASGGVRYYETWIERGGRWSEPRHLARFDHADNQPRLVADGVRRGFSFQRGDQFLATQLDVLRPIPVDGGRSWAPWLIVAAALALLILRLLAFRWSGLEVIYWCLLVSLLVHLLLWWLFQDHEIEKPEAPPASEEGSGAPIELALEMFESQSDAASTPVAAQGEAVDVEQTEHAAPSESFTPEERERALASAAMPTVEALERREAERARPESRHEPGPRSDTVAPSEANLVEAPTGLALSDAPSPEARSKPERETTVDRTESSAPSVDQPVREATALAERAPRELSLEAPSVNDSESARRPEAVAAHERAVDVAMPEASPAARAAGGGIELAEAPTAEATRADRAGDRPVGEAPSSEPAESTPGVARTTRGPESDAGVVSPSSLVSMAGESRARPAPSVPTGSVPASPLPDPDREATTVASSLAGLQDAPTSDPERALAGGAPGRVDRSDSGATASAQPVVRRPAASRGPAPVTDGPELDLADSRLRPRSSEASPSAGSAGRESVVPASRDGARSVASTTGESAVTEPLASAERPTVERRERATDPKPSASPIGELGTALGAGLTAAGSALGPAAERAGTAAPLSAPSVPLSSGSVAQRSAPTPSASPRSVAAAPSPRGADRPLPPTDPRRSVGGRADSAPATGTALSPSPDTTATDRSERALAAAPRAAADSAPRGPRSLSRPGSIGDSAPRPAELSGLPSSSTARPTTRGATEARSPASALPAAERPARAAADLAEVSGASSPPAAAPSSSEGRESPERSDRALALGPRPASPSAEPTRPAGLPRRGERLGSPVAPGEAPSGLPESAHVARHGPPSRPATTPGEREVDLVPWVSARLGAKKVEALERHGGDAKTERAVAAGLAYLASIQAEDGSWGRRSKVDPKYGETMVGTTALSTLAFLGAGHHPGRESEYRGAVTRAIAYLLEAQTRGGHFGFRTSAYSHGISAYALGEAYLLSKDPDLLPPLRRAIDHLLAQQELDPDQPTFFGGWSYYYDDGHRYDRYPRVSVTVWQVMAVETATFAGLDIDPGHLKAARHYLEESWSPRLQRMLYNRKPSRLRSQYPTLPGSTPAATFALLLLGADPESAAVQGGLTFVSDRPPSVWRQSDTGQFIRNGSGNPYFWYYGTLALFLRGGPAWDAWNERLKATLLPSQEEDGSWEPISIYADYAGDTERYRAYTTALNVLMLEVYYRYLTPFLESSTTRSSGGSAEDPPGSGR